MTDTDKKALGRNDPCHCGSGKKYKQCHLSQDEAAARAVRAKAQQGASEETAAAAPADAPERPRERKPRAQTAQPWKKSQATRGMPRFSAPRRTGGS